MNPKLFIPYLVMAISGVGLLIFAVLIGDVLLTITSLAIMLIGAWNMGVIIRKTGEVK